MKHFPHAQVSLLHVIGVYEEILFTAFQLLSVVLKMPQIVNLRSKGITSCSEALAHNVYYIHYKTWPFNQQ